MNVLTDKSYRTYKNVSRYSNFPYYYNSLDNKYIYGTTAHLDDSTPYNIHLTSRNDSLDKMALKYYNNPTLYWVIADFNRIQDPFIIFSEGVSIRIPVFSTIVFEA